MTASSSSEQGARLSALLATRRWLLLLLVTVAWSLAFLVGLLQFGRLPTADRVLLLAAAACAVAGWILSRRTIGLWILLGAPACLVLATALGGAPGVAWIALPVSASHVAYGLVILTSRRIGLIAIGVVTAVVILIWQGEPQNVVAGALSVGGGWIAIVTLAASAAAVWWVWHALLRQALAADEAYVNLAARTAREHEIQERSRALRAAAVTVHETLLSTIRYLLQTSQVDRSALAEYIRNRPTDGSFVPAVEADRDVTSATAARIATDIVRLDPSSFDLPIEEDARAAVRAALVECSLNAVLHGGATEVIITGRRSGGRVFIDVTDNGSGIDPDATPGLGWTAVLTEGLAAWGGTWSTDRVGDRTVVTLALPAAGARSVFGGPDGDDGFDQGRILITAPLATTALLGVGYDALIAWGERAGVALMAVVLAGIAMAGVAVFRQRRVSLLFSIATVIALGLVPWAILLTDPEASQSVLVASAINAAGYGVISVAVWSRWWTWLIGLGVWTAGIVALVSQTPDVKAAPVLVALVNCLVAVPIVVSVSAVGTRRLASAQAALERDRQIASREALRGSAALLVDQHLSRCVQEAESIIDRLAAGAELDDVTRNELACLEGLIRVTIQVDPVSGGGVAHAASQLVTSAFNARRPVQVGTVISSGDQRPMPRQLVAQLDRALAGASSVALRAFTDGSRDYLALEFGSGADGDGEEWTVDDVDVSVDSVNGRTVAIASRSVQA